MLTWNDELRLAANLRWLFTEWPDAERVTRAAAAGFGGVEVPAPYPYAAAELSARVRDAGVHVVSINTPAGGPGSPTAWGTACLPDERDAFRRGFSTALTYAVALGADLIHVMGGQRPAGLDPDRAYETYLDNVSWASEQATSTEVCLVIEAINRVDVPGFVLRSVEHAIATVKAVGSANLRVLFDVYHCEMNQEGLLGQLREALPLVAHVQIADAPGRHEPGTGSIPWQPLFDQLVSSGYSHWVGCEYAPRSHTRDSLGWSVK